MQVRWWTNNTKLQDDAHCRSPFESPPMLFLPVAAGHMDHWSMDIGDADGPDDQEGDRKYGSSTMTCHERCECP